MSNWKFCALRAPIWRMSAYSATSLGVMFGKQFRDDRQAGFAARLGQQLQTLFAETLEFVRRCARLERAAAKNRRARLLHRVRRGQQLLFAFDRAGPGHDLKFFSANDIVRGP